MNATKMLHEMCHIQLSVADIKTICKTRGLPSQAAKSRNLLESLFVSDTGVAAALQTLDSHEVSLLHLLGAIDEPVDISFFNRMYPGKRTGAYGLTYTQRYQEVFSKVTERLIRRRLLLFALAPESWQKKLTNMERVRFALPSQFTPYLPPLLQSTKPLAGDGDLRRTSARDKLATEIGKSPHKTAKDEDKLEIVDRELRFGGKPFLAEQLLAWQKKHWGKELPSPKRVGSDRHSLPPVDALTHILGGLADGFWCDADELTSPLEIFCGSKIDSAAVCDVGWRLGLLARQRADGKMWFRLASHSPAVDVPPHRYLDTTSDGNVTVDLDTVPLESLEQIVTVSSQQAGPGHRPVLLITPDAVKLGRVADAVLALPLVTWLRKNASSFHRVIEAVEGHRGKTILHENLAVARVTDLSLKVAIQKALGDHVVQMGKEYIAFPHDRIADVKRVVTKSGHVVKEVSHRGN